MARFDDDLMRRVRQLYWPRIDEDGKLIEPRPFPAIKTSKGLVDDPRNNTYDPESTDKYDPSVVWVGPFSDAMIHFDLFKDRQLFKTFMYEVNHKGPGEGWDFTLERCIDIGDTTWPHLDAEYIPTSQMLRLHSLSGAPGDTADPGEVKNSPTNVGNVGALFPGITAKEYKEVTIAVDPQYKLHILRRGDRLRKSFKSPNGERRKEVFALRPLHEGASVIAGVRGEQPITV